MSSELRYWDLKNGSLRLSIIEEDFRSLLKECGRLNSLLEAKEEQNRTSTKKHLKELLEVLDAFARVFGNVEEKAKDIDAQTKRWINTFRIIHKKIEGILRNTGISQIEAPEGKAVPGCHTVVETRKVQGLNDDTILEEIEKGYLWNGEVLRKSSVITVKNGREG